MSFGTREKFLLSGEAGAGKTSALFDIAKKVLDGTKHQVFMMVCDDGAAKYLRKVRKYIASTETTIDLEIPTGSDPRFFYYLTPDFMNMRDTYREIRKIWKRGDWFMIDRADLTWDGVQQYFSAAAEGISEDELDMVFLAKRVDKRQEAKRLMEKVGTEQAKKMAQAILNSITVADNRPLDWNLIKDGYNGIVWDAFAGRDPARMGINVAATTLVVAKGQNYTGDSPKKDPRILDALGVVIQGEKNLPGYPDSHLLFRVGPKGYTITTVKDRGRPAIIDAVIDPEVGFWDVYRSMAMAEEEEDD
jgi:hypothetical protein